MRENQVLNHSGNKGYGRSNKEAKLNNESTISPEAKSKKSAYKLNVRIKQKSKNFRELAWNNFDKNNSQMLTNFGALYTEDMLQYGIQPAYNVNRYLSLSQTYLQERFTEPYQATRKARGCLKK